MADRITPEFYCAEADRLLQLAATTVDRITRVDLLEMAARYRQMAAQLKQHAEVANSNDILERDLG